MIESPFDRVGGSLCTVHGVELAAWERLCLRLRIDAVWQMLSFGREAWSLAFSRSDRRLDGTNLARLDRFYVSDWCASRGDSVGIVAGSSFSDHAPVVIFVTLERQAHVPAIRILDSVIEDASSVGRLRDAGFRGGGARSCCGSAGWHQCFSLGRGF